MSIFKDKSHSEINRLKLVLS